VFIRKGYVLLKKDTSPAMLRYRLEAGSVSNLHANLKGGSSDGREKRV